MSQSKKKIQDILGYLSDQIGRGWIALLVAKYIHQANTNKKITCAQYFFTSTYLSSTESAVLALSRLVVPHDDSISIHYLLNCASQSPKVFAYANKNEIAEAVEKHKQELNTIAALIENVKTHRDRTIAHLDKKYVNNPDVIFADPPADMVEIEKAYGLVLRIINAYKGYFDSSELHMAHLDAIIEDDFTYLIGLIREADER